MVKFLFTFWSHLPRATDAIGFRAAMYADSELEMPVAVRTNGVLGHVAGLGAYPETGGTAAVETR